MVRDDYSERIERAYAQQFAAQKRYRDKTKAQHKCAACLKPMPEDYNKSICEACRAKYNSVLRERYSYYISIDVCPKCKKNKLAPGRKTCRSCALKLSQISQKYQQKLIANGRCPRCGAALGDAKGQICEACRAKRNAYNVEYRLKRKEING